jgi:hypothetical protein
MLRNLALALALLLCGCLPASAQTHPCDQPAPTSATVSSSGAYKVQFCAKPSDGLEAFVVYVNGTTAADLRPLTMVSAPNVSGYALYEGPKELTFPRGSYVVEVAVYNRPYPGGPTQLSARSSPLALAAVDDNPPPAAPKVMGVVK